MPSRPTGPTQVTKTGDVGSMDVSGRSIYSHLALGGRVINLQGRERSKKSAKNRESQWHAQSADWAHTGNENGRCGFYGRFRAVHLFTFGFRV